MIFSNKILYFMVTLVMLFAHKAYSNGYPVLDAVNARVNQEQQAEETTQTRLLQDMMNELRRTNESLGQAKSSLMKSQIEHYVSNAKKAGWQELAPATHFEPLLPLLPGGKTQLIFDDIKTAKETIKSVLYGNVNTVTDANKYRDIRKKLANGSAMQAYALALYNRQQLANHAADTKNLVHSITQGEKENLVNEIAANTAVLLALHEQLAALQALLSALTEMEAASMLAADQNVAFDGK